MATETENRFDFDFAGQDRAQLLAEVKREVKAYNVELKGDERRPDAETRAALKLLDGMNREVAEFGAFPDVIKLDEADFAAHGQQVPPRFAELTRQHRFYWVRFPVTLSPVKSKPFVKLECAVEFNPGVGDGHLRPRAHLILPDRRFSELVQINESLDLRLGVSGELDVATPRLDFQLGAAKAKAGAGFDAAANAKAEVKVGPFAFRVRSADVWHTPAGTEKVFWRLSGAEFVHEDDPTFIVVLQVPREIAEVRVSAALQAYHRASFGVTPLSDAFDYFIDRLAAFLSAGAPVRSIKVWDITPRLS
jgi:hypothetical protein